MIIWKGVCWWVIFRYLYTSSFIKSFSVRRYWYLSCLSDSLSIGRSRTHQRRSFSWLPLITCLCELKKMLLVWRTWSQLLAETFHENYIDLLDRNNWSCTCIKILYKTKESGPLGIVFSITRVSQASYSPPLRSSAQKTYCWNVREKTPLPKLTHCFSPQQKLVWKVHVMWTRDWQTLVLFNWKIPF